MILKTPVGTPIGVTYEEMRMTKEKWKNNKKLDTLKNSKSPSL
jgi:hypothetical protein